MNYPWCKFYPRDWMGDPVLRSCTYAARGLWADMLCLMAMNEARRGFLEIGGRALTEPSEIARLTSGECSEAQRLLAELEKVGVFSRDESGCIYSRRMVNDDQLSQTRRLSGAKGGNPVLTNQKPTDLVNQMQNQKAKQNVVSGICTSGSSGSHGKEGSGEEGKSRKAVLREQAVEVLEYLNEKAGQTYRLIDTHLKPIEDRLSEVQGDVDEVLRMLDRKITEWRGNPEMDKFLRPSTLFRKTNFHNYFDQRRNPVVTGKFSPPPRKPGDPF